MLDNLPVDRLGLGDDTGRHLQHEHGDLEYRFAPAHTCEIVNIEVNNLHRREGIGRQLVEELLREATAHKTHLVYAISRLSNSIAHDFWRGMGFRVLALLERFYGEEDAVAFGKDVP